mgnify:FL=1
MENKKDCFGTGAGYEVIECMQCHYSNECNAEKVKSLLKDMVPKKDCKDCKNISYCYISHNYGIHLATPKVKSCIGKFGRMDNCEDCFRCYHQCIAKSSHIESVTCTCIKDVRVKNMYDFIKGSKYTFNIDRELHKIYYDTTVIFNGIESKIEDYFEDIDL